MSCPELDSLLARQRAGWIDAHLRRCGGCRGALALALARAGCAAPLTSCAEAEVLIAVRDAGPLAVSDAALLALHVASCRGCRRLAGG